MAGLAYSLEDSAPLGSARSALFRGGLRGLAFGVGANVVALRFVPGVITRFTPLPWAVGVVALVLLAMAQALRWVVAAWVRNALVRWRVPRPWAFAAAVYTGTFVPVIFPWNPAGGATLRPELVQLADVIGERGVSALMALSAGLLAAAVRAFRAWRRGARSPRNAIALAACALAVPLLSAIHGRMRMAEVEALRARAETANVALVQPSIGATQRWDRHRAGEILSSLSDLTRRAERDGAELTIWHESAYPYELAHTARQAPKGPHALLQEGVRGPVLAGLILHGSDLDRSNSAMIAYADGTLSAPYDKLHLLWFGETVPLADEIPWIRRTFARGLGLTRGEAQTVLVSGKIRASVLICFEDTLPAAGREAMGFSPNLLVNVTNDAWFTPLGGADTGRGIEQGRPKREDDEASTESELHLRMAIMRSIEGRRDLVRAVNFGPTTWVDAAGRVRARYASTTPGTLLATPALLEWPATFYVRFGDLPFAVLVLATTLSLGLVEKRRARPGRGAVTTDL